jgi:putative phosphoribosyl transferase
MTHHLLPHQLTIGTPPLMAELAVPAHATALVLLVHSDLASRSEPGQRYMTERLQAHGFATLTLSLRQVREEIVGAPPLRPGMAAARLQAVLAWIGRRHDLGQRRIGVFGIGAAAPACVAATRAHADGIDTLVLLDGQFDPDVGMLAELPQPALLLVGAGDEVAESQARRALAVLCGASRLQLLPCVTQPLAESGACEVVARRASDWFTQRLRRTPQGPVPTPAARPSPIRTAAARTVHKCLSSRPTAAD